MSTLRLALKAGEQIDYGKLFSRISPCTENTASASPEKRKDLDDADEAAQQAAKKRKFPEISCQSRCASAIPECPPNRDSDSSLCSGNVAFCNMQIRIGPESVENSGATQWLALLATALDRATGGRIPLGEVKCQVASNSESLWICDVHRADTTNQASTEPFMRASLDAHANDQMSDTTHIDSWNWLRAALTLAEPSLLDVRCSLEAMGLPVTEPDQTDAKTTQRPGFFSDPLATFQFMVSMSCAIRGPWRTNLLAAAKQTFLRVALFQHGRSRSPTEVSRPDLSYSSLYSPPVSPTAHEEIGVDSNVFNSALSSRGFCPVLFPFQRRTVLWLLAREGKRMVASPGNAVSDIVDVSSSRLRELRRGPYWFRLHTSRAEDVWINHVQGQFVFTDPGEGALATDFLGSSVLAEPIGCGKTLEIIALILLHRDHLRKLLPPYFSAALQTQVYPSGLTLIICPSTILEQWKGELASHAPTLKVLHYNGVKHMLETSPAAIASNFDIVLATFETVRREVHIAKAPPSRETRSAASGESVKYKRSILAQLDVFRLVIDEIQMESSTTAASETAALVPRKFSIASSGTPLTRSIENLQGIFKCLKADPFATDRKAFNRLVSPLWADDLRCIIRTIGVRNSPAVIQAELRLPIQRRFLVPIELSAVERYAHEALAHKARSDLGFDSTTPPSLGQLDRQLLAHYLTALRQNLVHPSVGEEGRKAFGSGEVKSIDDILKALVEENEAAVCSDRRSLYVSLCRRAHITMLDRFDCERFEKATALLTLARNDLQRLSKEMESASRADVAAIEGHILAMVKRPSQADSVHHSPPGQNHQLILSSVLSSRQLDIIKAEHQANFLLGNCYFAMGKFPAEESASYGAAEALRLRVLFPLRVRFNTDLNLLEDVAKVPLSAGELQIPIPASLEEGFSSRIPFDSIARTSRLANCASALLLKQRSEVISGLLEDLDLTEEETSFELSAARQETIDTHMEMMALLVLDWRALITGARVHVANHLRDTSSLAQAQKREKWSMTFSTVGKRGGQRQQNWDPNPTDPPHVSLYKSLHRQRRDALEDSIASPGVPLQHSLRELRELTDHSTRIHETERQICLSEISRLRGEIADKIAIADRLQNELRTVLSRVFNTRIAYFRQLQVFSDSVADIDFYAPGFRGVDAELRIACQLEEGLELEIEARQAKGRYLAFLAAGNRSLSANERVCGVCTEPIQKGYISQSCAHIFCLSCFKGWRSVKRTCALCKVPLTRCSKIVGDAARLRAEAPTAPVIGLHPNDSPSVSSSAFGDLRGVTKISAFEQSKIEEENIHVNISSKIDFAIRHINAIRRQTPDAKIIVFLGFTRGLEILRTNFVRHLIPHAVLNRRQAVKEFVEDSSVNVLLLHAQAHGAGLTLTVATTLIFLEPLLLSSQEAQAAGRLLRIGQAQETRVFVYATSDSVEERILERAVVSGRSVLCSASYLDEAARVEQVSRRATKKAESTGSTSAEDIVRILGFNIMQR